MSTVKHVTEGHDPDNYDRECSAHTGDVFHEISRRDGPVDFETLFFVVLLLGHDELNTIKAILSIAVALFSQQGPELLDFRFSYFHIIIF